jgi:hypothetical protein
MLLSHALAEQTNLAKQTSQKWLSEFYSENLNSLLKVVSGLKSPLNSHC